MAEPFSIAASVNAVIQITDRVISLCKLYIQTARDAPKALRIMLIEVSALTMVLENVKFLCECDEELSAVLDLEEQGEGPNKGCHRALENLESLFPPTDLSSQTSRKRNKNRLGASLRALEWPLKANKAKSLLEEITQYKATITFAIATSSAQDIQDIKEATHQIKTVLTENNDAIFTLVLSIQTRHRFIIGLRSPMSPEHVSGFSNIRTGSDGCKALVVVFGFMAYPAPARPFSFRISLIRSLSIYELRSTLRG